MQSDCAQGVIDAARACLGTPFLHQGRVPGVGLDCLGLVVVAYRANHFKINDRIDYTLQPDGTALQQGLAQHGEMVDDVWTPADVMLFRLSQGPQHVGLYVGENRIIHAYLPAGRVVEISLTPNWRRRVCGVYRFLGTKNQQERFILH